MMRSVSTHAVSGRHRLPAWTLVAAALGVGVTIGTGLALIDRSTRVTPASALPTRADSSWAAGARPAPNFRLVDGTGEPISLRLFRGRPVILTFIDPVCRTFCTFEARALNQVVSSISPAKRPTVVAVSVNPWAQSRADLQKAGRRWHLLPQWHWAIGRYRKLAAVWKRYGIGVRASERVVAGAKVQEIAHTEASFIIDPAGYERALYLYPFRPEDVARTMRDLLRARS